MSKVTENSLRISVLSAELIRLEQRHDLYTKFLSGIPAAQQTSRLQTEWIIRMGLVDSLRNCIAGAVADESLMWLGTALGNLTASLTPTDKQQIYDEVFTYGC